MSTQTTQLKRVRSLIGDLVIDFCSNRVGKEFYGWELTTFVADRVTHVAPGSSDRILRDLRQSGEVAYTVVSRAQSRYYVDRVNA
jgi:hypothetical protein